MAGLDGSHQVVGAIEMVCESSTENISQANGVNDLLWRDWDRRYVLDAPAPNNVRTPGIFGQHNCRRWAEALPVMYHIVRRGMVLVRQDCDIEGRQYFCDFDKIS